MRRGATTARILVYRPGYMSGITENEFVSIRRMVDSRVHQELDAVQQSGEHYVFYAGPTTVEYVDLDHFVISRELMVALP